VVIVATNHSEFERPETLQAILSLASADCLLADPWNSFGTAQVFLYVAESAALAAGPAQVDASPDVMH
jgi:hypothetical protein